MVIGEDKFVELTKAIEKLTNKLVMDHNAITEREDSNVKDASD